MAKEYICIYCEKTKEQLKGLKHVKFPGTGYLLCCLCYEKLGSSKFFGLNIGNPPQNNYKKKKIPHEIRKDVYERDAYRCVYCGSYKNLTLDHVHPESLGGATTLENLVTCCHSCNVKKGTKLGGKTSGESST